MTQCQCWQQEGIIKIHCARQATHFWYDGSRAMAMCQECSVERNMGGFHHIKRVTEDECTVLQVVNE